MELGTPFTLKHRTRSRGSKRSEDSLLTTPVHRTFPPNTPGSRSHVINTPGPRSNGMNTPGTRICKMMTPLGGILAFNTPQSHQRSTAEFSETPGGGDETPRRGVEQSGARSMLVSPSTHPGSLLSPSTNRKKGSPRATLRTQAEEKSPIAGRITQVFQSLPFSHNFELKDRIGEGTFSTVYLAHRKDRDVKIALKHLVPTSKPSRIVMETGCMCEAAGHPNVIQLLGMWRVEGDVVLAMPYVKHSRFSDLIFSMDLAETVDYIGNLLAALRHIHKLGIIHRDIKPSNFLYDREERKYSLVDFGLAQHEKDLMPAVREEGRGCKRKLSDINMEASKSAKDRVGEEEREVLEDMEKKLNKSPKARILRDFKMQRRSPRKLYSPGKEDCKGMEVSSDITPRKRLRLQTTPRKDSLTLPVRQSPRKHLSRPAGFSKLTITANSILGSSFTPSPSLSRTPSFTMLEPASYTASQLSQTTDTVPGRTPLLRASITSAYNSSVHAVPPPTRVQSAVHCSCNGKARVCSACLTLPHMHAPRAGTPGFRPPEVLLKYPNQTIAIDLWAVGVIMISILSRSYPFFRAPDDMTALAELTVLFGTKAVKDLAKRYGRSLLTSAEAESLDLRFICRELSTRERREEAAHSPDKSLGLGKSSHHVTEEGIDLLASLLTLDHSKRITAEEALNHSYFKNANIR